MRLGMKELSSWWVGLSICVGISTILQHERGELLAGEGRPPQLMAAGARPEQYPLNAPDRLPVPAPPASFRPVRVPTVLDAPVAYYRSATRTVDGPLWLSDPPKPAAKKRRGVGHVLPPSALRQASNASTPVASPVFPGQLIKSTSSSLTPSLSLSFDSTDFETNDDNGGTLFIPPDSHAAAGMNHIVNVANVTIRFHQKNGSLDADMLLATFFSPLSPLTATFDPKVVYDQFEDRFVVVTLEQTDEANIEDDENTSRLLVAVSDDGDPNGTWYMAAIDTLTTISTVDHWADYPGFAVDEEAVYVTANMFEFAADGGNFGGVRLWVIDKGVTGGLYDDNTAVVSVFDPVPSGFAAGTTQPAHMFDTPVPAGANVGTFLSTYDGLTDTATGNEFLQVVRIDDPLGTPTFTGEFVNLGNVDNIGTVIAPVELPDAPQMSAQAIQTNDRRVINTVWRNNALWVATTVGPNAGDPDAGEATAYWVKIDTSNLADLSLADGGSVGGEDIAANTHTFYPSIAVNSVDDMALSFSASASTIFPSSYYTSRQPGDALGTTRQAAPLRVGTDFYVRTFGLTSNRWGDYSSMVVDPVTDCFWSYNEHALMRGTLTNPGAEEGRWGTAAGTFCACPFDLTVPGQSLSGNFLFAAQNIVTVGEDVTLQSGTNMTIRANSARFQSGFNASGSTLHVDLSPDPCR